jgi:predicted cupin superfamily sugar epimerase
MGVTPFARALGLAPHPEGGWFRETWRSPLVVDTPRGSRPAGTSILYLLEAGEVSRLHRLAFDEVWHWQGGGALLIHHVTPTGLDTVVLDAARPQHVVPGGVWFGAEPVPGASHVLAGCTMAPGFHADDWELADGRELAAALPQAADIIGRLTDGGAGR